MSRYLVSLLIFLGLLGTFWGLLETVSAVANTIQNLDVSSGNTGVIFEDLKAGLTEPLGGMGTAFSSSLFGLAGSLILGFLDLQAGQAQNMFYNDLEDWLSTVTDLDPELIEGRGGTTAEDLRVAIERLSRAIQEGQQPQRAEAGSTQRANAAMAELAGGIRDLVQHVRSEQQVVRSWVEAQSEQQRELQHLLETISRALQTPAGE
jgi:methyl-accepting chemotaxis protein